MKQMFSNAEKTAKKKRLLQQCIELIEMRIAANTQAIANAQDAANAEEKSSAGDKYETSRAMSHLEKDMHSRQLTANRMELAALFGLDCSSLYSKGAKGSLVACEDCSFFIAAGLGKINFEGEDIYLLSPDAPLATLLFKRKAGDIILFNKKQRMIIAVF